MDDGAAERAIAEDRAARGQGTTERADRPQADEAAPGPLRRAARGRGATHHDPRRGLRPAPLRARPEALRDRGVAAALADAALLVREGMGDDLPAVRRE